MSGFLDRDSTVHVLFDVYGAVGVGVPEPSHFCSSFLQSFSNRVMLKLLSSGSTHSAYIASTVASGINEYGSGMRSRTVDGKAARQHKPASMGGVNPFGDKDSAPTVRFSASACSKKAAISPAVGLFLFP